MRPALPDFTIAKSCDGTAGSGGIGHSALEVVPSNAPEKATPVEVSDRSHLILPDLSEKGERTAGPAGDPRDGAAKPAPGPLLSLINEAAELRPRYADAGERQDNIACHLLAVAFRIAVMAGKDEILRKAIRGEAKRLGARPNSRSGIEHIAVDTAFGPRTSLRTRHAQAVRAGIALHFTPEQFAKRVAKGSSGKSGIKALAKIGRQKRTANGPAPASTRSSPNPNPEPHLNVGRRISLPEHGYLTVVLVLEEAQQTLLASGLKTSDEFLLLVRITPTNGLEGVKFLGAHHTSNRGDPAEGR
jgi:hypothetical protein